MATSDVVKIPSEDELWTLLQALLNGTADGRSAVELKGWRPELLYFPEEPTGHTVSPSVARAITEFHRSLSRSYAYLAYGQANASILLQDDKKLLDVRFLITDGSSGVSIEDLVVDAIISGLIGKMSGEEITVTIVVFLLLYFSHSVGRHWINQAYEAKRHVRSAEEREKLSAEETRRAEIMAAALTQHPQLAPLQDVSEEAKRGLVSAARSYPHSRVIGADLTSKEAGVILSREREKGIGRRIDGLFEIARINPEYEDGYFFRLKRADTGDEIEAEANYSELPQEDIHLLFDVAENKGGINALVNAWFIGDRIVRARIVRVNKPDTSNDPG